MREIALKLCDAVHKVLGLMKIAKIEVAVEVPLVKWLRDLQVDLYVVIGKGAGSEVLGLLVYCRL